MDQICATRLIQNMTFDISCVLSQLRSLPHSLARNNWSPRTDQSHVGSNQVRPDPS